MGTNKMKEREKEKEREEETSTDRKWKGSLSRKNKIPATA